MFSKLTDKVILTDHYDSRNENKIDKITIHHMAGNLSIETCGSVFQTREASAQYGIGSDGRIGGYVPEEYRAWSTSNPANDRRAINIELANDGGADTDWHVSDITIEKCIELCVDICQRYGFTLNYTGDSNGSLTRHNMFVATTCPGGYLQSKFPYIAEEVNKRLKESQPKAGDIFKVNEPTGLWLLDENGAKKQCYNDETQVEYIEMGYYKYNYQYYKVKVSEDGNVGYMASAYLTKVSNAAPPEPTPSDDKTIEELEKHIEELNCIIDNQIKEIEQLKQLTDYMLSCKEEFLIEKDSKYRVKIKAGEILMVKPKNDMEYTINLKKDDEARIK